jgi:hypothetical protein
VYPDVKVYADVSGNPLSDPPTWTEITAYVCHESIEIARGQGAGVGDVQPGTLSLSLIDDGRFDPSATAGAYYPDFTLRTRIYVAANDSWADDDEYLLFSGYITSLRQRWNHRAEQIADVTAIDVLGVLATVELPESAWDHVIGNRTGKVAWHKLGTDSTSTVRDYSGNGADARYVTYEGSVGPYGAARTPDVIVQAGVSDPIIAQVDRPSQSWGKMIAEAGQPLGTIDATVARGPRSTSIVCDQTTAALQEPGQDWSVEMWLTYRPALSMVGDFQFDSQVDTYLFQWGDNGDVYSSGPMLRWVIPEGQRYVVPRWYDGSGTIGEGSSVVVLPVSGQADPLHVVFAHDSGTVTIYVNGTSAGTVSISSAPLARGFPLFLAPTWYGPGATNLGSWWGTLGDVVIYNRAITSTEVEASYVAGRWGRIDSTAGALKPGDAIDQILTIISGDLYVQTGSFDVGEHDIIPGPLNARSALEYVRTAASSDGGVLFSSRRGRLVYNGPNWPLDYSSATWIVTDDDIADPGGGSFGAGGVVVGHTGATLATDEQGVANDVSVRWHGGEVRSANTTSVATFGRLRSSVATVLSDVRDAQSRAEFEAWRLGAVRAKVDAVTVEPASEADWYCAMTSDLLTRMRVIVTRPDGTQVDRDYHVAGVRHSIDMGQGAWRTTFSLTPADWPAKPFVIGTSELNGPDVVWY